MYNYFKGDDAMCKLPERLKRLREETNTTQAELAEELGYKNYTTITKWESGTNLPRGKELKLLAEKFGVSSDYILGLSDVRRIESETNITHIYNQLTPPRQSKVYKFAEHQLQAQNNKVVPLVGATAANPTALEYADAINDISINTDVPNNADCALVVRGNSMEPDYMDSSIVFYKRQESVENGELAIIEVEGDGVTFKKVIFDYENQQLILRSLNEEYPDRILKDNEYRIIGKVVK